MTTWDGQAYQRRFDELAADGADVHGEADLVESLGPRHVLDAGCGTGRVAIELSVRGLEVVGVDRDPSMLAVARDRRPEVRWVEGDMARVDLGEQFDLVVMAGNVPLFTEPEGRSALVAGCARHLLAGGLLVAGFQTGRGYPLSEYDRDCTRVGLSLVERWATWDRRPFGPGGDDAVSVHRLAGLPGDRPA